MRHDFRNIGASVVTWYELIVIRIRPWMDAVSS